MKYIRSKKIIFVLIGVVTISLALSFYYFYNSNSRIILIGVDGVDWDVLLPLIAKGKLPNIKRLMDNSAYGNSRSMEPMVSPSLWTTIASGKTFQKHGINSFVITPPGSDNPIPVTSNLRKTKTIWNILTERKKKTIMINYPVTYPPEQINGIIISRLDYFSEYPSSHSYVTSYAIYPDSIRPMVSNLRNQAIANLDSREAFGELANLLILEKVTLGFIDQDWDFFTTYTKSTDEVGHIYWKYMEPDKFQDKRWGVIEENIKKYGSRIEEIYKETDNFIGQILTKIDKNTTVFIASDHGMKAASEFDPENPVDSGVHDIEGIIIISGKNIKSKCLIKNASILDITPTMLYLLDLPIGKDMDGRVLLEAISPLYRLFHRVRYIESYDADWQRDKEEKPVKSVFDEQIIQRLKSLGYLH